MPLFDSTHDRRLAATAPADPDASGTLTSAERVTTPPVATPLIPPRFHLLQKLGQGGMGIVHRAFDSVRGCEVALKAINVSRADDLYRLKREFRFLADLSHPNLVKLHELFVCEDSAFFTMELLFGTDFCRFIRGPSVGARKAQRQAWLASCDYSLLRLAARQLAAALSAVHAAGKLHRDVKPSNILVTSAGRVVLFDFGLAASMCPASQKTKGAGVLLGTRGYIAPEQARGEALSIAADWYSFGVTLFEAITGRLPCEDGYKSFLADRDADVRVHISRFMPDAPADLDELLANLLSPVPQKRPTEAEILRVLDDARRSGNVPRPNPPARPRTPPEAVEPALAQALASIQGKGPAILHVRGENDLETTEVARRAVAEAERLGALVLMGKCRNEEKLAFNAMDEVVDNLSHVLEHMPYRDLISVLPPEVAALPRLFPVLARLESASDLIFVKRGEREEVAMLRARAAFKELVAGLAERKPIVIWIDGVEKGDRASGELLGELLVPPDTQPILVVLSYPGDAGRSGMLDALAEQCGSVPSFEITVPDVDARPGRCA
jgi:serine/threonine protein kinase